ncbi:MAG: AtpZ/AtpI family protein [Actinobacteria bacterium]|nr:AtpZ/AtpI family protein [Actinomycetota bacterium]
MKKTPRYVVPDAWSLAFTFVACVLVCTGIGYVLDRLLHTLPWIMVTGVFVGAAIGLTYLVYLLFAGGSGRRKGKAGADQDGESDRRSS